jgi:hypothetical protein
MTGIQGNPLPFSSTDVESEYDPNLIRQIVQALLDLNEGAFIRGGDVQIIGAPDSAGRKPDLYLRSPNGQIWRVDVANTTGALSTTLVTF